MLETLLAYSVTTLICFLTVLVTGLKLFRACPNDQHSVLWKELSNIGFKPFIPGYQLWVCYRFVQTAHKLQTSWK